QRVDIFALDYDAILAAMYALTVGAEGDCYLCVPPNPGIEAAALGARESALSGTVPAEALHTFTLDSGASRCFFRDSTTVTRILAPVAVSLADPSGGPVLARFSTVLQCAASFRMNGSPRLLVSGLPRSLPALPHSPPPLCLPCVKGQQHAAPHSSSFPPTEAPPQTLHMDVWGPACVHRQGREQYFLLVVDDYSRYTTVFPLRSKGEVPVVLIPWIRAVRLQLRDRFDPDLLVLRLHSDRVGDFVSDLLRDFCRGEGIRYKFTLPASLQQNEVAECHIGLVMEFYHPTSHRVLPSQDITFDESVPFYHLFPYRTAPLPPPPLFLAPGPPPADPLPPQGPAPSGVSQVDPVGPVEVAVDSGADGGGAARGAASGGAEPEGAGPGGAETERAEPGVAEPGVAQSGGAEPERAEPGGAELGGDELGGAELECPEPGGTLSTRAPPGSLSRREPLSPPQLREWFARRWILQSGAAGVGGPTARGPGAGGFGAAGPGGAGGSGFAGVAGVGAGSAGAGAAGGIGAAGPGGARTGGTGVAGAGAGGAKGAGA
ncbi:unnamed protein product, partial [Closterium sp. NIES-53]